MPYKGKGGKNRGTYRMDRKASDVRRRSKPGKSIPSNRYRYK